MACRCSVGGASEKYNRILERVCMREKREKEGNERGRTNRLENAHDSSEVGSGVCSGTVKSRYPVLLSAKLLSARGARRQDFIVFQPGPGIYRDILNFS